MKTYIAGAVTVFAMIIVAGIGFGTAQAEETHTGRPVYGFEYQGSLQVVNAPEEDMEPQGPIGVGTLPSADDTPIDDIDSQDQGEYTGRR